ncbi:sigma-70 family RNA polymerase sigma factor [Polyangium jinanense]|uniref:Sigma-70 family RNA polymerase sigma factor n=1 Tax=Polyangium jinanense TaxID=2829994 RepID=A0A9X3XEV0_9BACT|nr:sigma-70 family RNA polymerase sigma factor [Polyangium jinanense]MDC3958179.1 sigma-70 family RNA polymerase sigma factor [Polyangium jinanense]MDC3988135.1 sigma-70 family RNA polymerase sigma factor [Polyangium jinanense]
MRARARKAGIPHIDIDDVVGEALLVACKEDEPRPPPECEERVVAWLLELVDWQVMAYWTRRARRSREILWPDPDAEELVADSRDHGSVIEARQQIELALKEVPAHVAEVVVARCAYGMRLSEFACETGISKNTVSSWFQRGEQAFREALVSLDKPKRRRGMVPLFLPFGDWLQSALRGLGRALESMFSKLVSGLVAGAAVVAFTPSSLDATAGELGQADMSVAQREPHRVEARRFHQRPGTADVIPKAADVSMRSSPPRPTPKQGERATKGTRPSPDPGLLILLAAKSALQQGTPGKAQALLEADAANHPDSANQRERDMLRALAQP